MTEALIVSNLALWVAVVVLAAVVLALMRQIGVLHERVAPAGALMPAAGLAVGSPAPVLQVPDWSGALQTVGGADPEGRSTLLLFVSPTCPLCKTMLSIAFSVQRSERAWLRLVLASDGPRTEHERFVRTHALDAYPYLLSTQLGLAYHVGKLPYAVLIDAGGTVRGRGLVNTREHLESLFEASERGVASVQEYIRRQHAHSEVA
ncbi:methylamine dehydrogenase accessory protein MauD [Candidatus Binatia bacterium]|nr:methylamine dehydrogenase accessory protein MauD [Candidatus Binatia bacterium]